MPPSMNNHQVLEATTTVPVTPSTPVATVPSTRITQAFMAPPPPPSVNKTAHEFSSQTTIVTNNQSKCTNIACIINSVWEQG